MNKKSFLRVMVMEGVEMLQKLLNISSNYGTTTLSQFLPMPPCSCLTCGISVGGKVFIYVCECDVLRLDGHTSM